MTRKMLLIAGAAGIALAAPATAERGGNKGGGDGPKAERQQVQRAERPQRVERQQMQRAERPQRMERMERREMRQADRPQRMERMERREMRQAERPQRIERMERREMRKAERPQRIERQERREIRRAERPQRIERQERREMRRAERPQRIERKTIEREARVERKALRDQSRFERQVVRAENRFERQALRDQSRFERQAIRTDNRFERQLAKATKRSFVREMREIPQQRVAIGKPVLAAALAPVPALYGTRYVDTGDYYHRYDDDYGYVYRIDRDDNMVSALFPLFGGYSAGDPWPAMYRSSYVPASYQPYYYDTPDYYHRYDGNAIYRIDAGTQLISGIVALLLGQQLGIGQMLPASYGTYNVPLAYRSNYYDTNDAWYRYGDGYIYQVDPYSRRIEQRYPLYADNYVVGQQWPVAYPGYNVPYGYRDVYYDTPDAHYRYANNGIYRVDPTTQLITALVALVSGQNFGIGQRMPSGYDVYNVPFAYRDQWYDNEDDYYRYANGYVYEIDADTGLIEDAHPVYA